MSLPSLARECSARLADIHYQLWFEISAQEQEDIHARASIFFDLAEAAQPLQLDFTGSGNSIHSLLVPDRARKVFPLFDQ